MNARFAAAAVLLLGALCLGGNVWANGENHENCVTRECDFSVCSQPVLKVGDCEDLKRTEGVCKSILVQTNTRTTVCITCSDFKRTELDCEGHPLKTSDTITAECFVEFKEFKCKTDCAGAPLEVKKLSEDCKTTCFCVNPHNGGFRIILCSIPNVKDIDLCDDAGKYTSHVTVLICSNPFEDCKGIEPGPGPTPEPGKPKGNNGVGNGLDPQPPGNPPINDGPGTGPGNPGNQGGPN
jgi:hypothetical protein